MIYEKRKKGYYIYYSWEVYEVLQDRYSVKKSVALSLSKKLYSDIKLCI